MFAALCSLRAKQRSPVLASYLGWTLDAFDFFILAFVPRDAADEFGTKKGVLSRAIFATLAVLALHGPEARGTVFAGSKPQEKLA